MGDNLMELLDQARSISDELRLDFCFHYTRDSVKFIFIKNYVGISWDFTLLEIDNAVDINRLIKILTDRVYSLLDKVREKG